MPKTTPPLPLFNPYAAAGVDIDAGNRLVQRIAPLAAKTHKNLPEGVKILGGVGGFGSAVEIPAGMKKPVLLSATDGVGSKLELAKHHNAPECIGVDVVAMCVNDLLCVGGMPLCFLDYIACGKLNEDFITNVIIGIRDACIESHCALVGGETAEMPGVYDAQGFDIAGFAVGIAEKEALIGRSAEEGDVLIALASSGAHSNGYSLIRKILAEHPELAQQEIEGKTVLERLLVPTRLYCRTIKKLREDVNLRGLAHITGGGLRENLTRVLPDNTKAQIDWDTLPLPPLFKKLQQAGNITELDMRRIFNCGVGMVAVVAAAEEKQALKLLNEPDTQHTPAPSTEAGEQRAWTIGKVVAA